MDLSSFSINKGQALDIINTIIISNPPEVILYDDGEPRLYDHKLSVVELFVDGAKKGDRIEDHQRNIIRQSHVLEYTRARLV